MAPLIAAAVVAAAAAAVVPLFSVSRVRPPDESSFVTNMPADAVSVACAILNGTAAPAGQRPAPTLLGRVNDAMNVFVNYTGQISCHNISMEMVGAASTTATGASRALLRRQQHYHHQQQQEMAAAAGQHGKEGKSMSSGVGGPQLGSIYDTWNYQACTELILEPLTSDGNGFYVETDAQARRCVHALRPRILACIDASKLLLL